MRFGRTFCVATAAGEATEIGGPEAHPSGSKLSPLRHSSSERLDQGDDEASLRQGDGFGGGLHQFLRQNQSAPGGKGAPVRIRWPRPV